MSIPAVVQHGLRAIGLYHDQIASALSSTYPADDTGGELEGKKPRHFGLALALVGGLVRTIFWFLQYLVHLALYPPALIQMHSAVPHSTANHGSSTSPSKLDVPLASTESDSSRDGGDVIDSSSEQGETKHSSAWTNQEWYERGSTRRKPSSPSSGKVSPSPSKGSAAAEDPWSVQAQRWSNAPTAIPLPGRTEVQCADDDRHVTDVVLSTVRTALWTPTPRDEYFVGLGPRLSKRRTRQKVLT